jgi:hypothetical protein
MIPTPTANKCFIGPLILPPQGAVLEFPSFQVFLFCGTFNEIDYNKSKRCTSISVGLGNILQET